MSGDRNASLRAEVAHLRPQNLLGLAYFSNALLLTAASFVFAIRPELASWAAGQVLLALALVQWFVLLHECGHGILFATPRWNDLAGQIAGLFSFIPYHCWTAIHNQHHRWTGWQDLDPTTATLVPRALSWPERILMTVCWRLWIPIFVLVYRLNNFWNWPRLRKLFPDLAFRKRLAVNIVGVLVVYAGITFVFGFLPLLRSFGVGILLSMIFLDSLILSQHTHIPMTVSEGEAVKPYSAREQEVFTRSLRFPRWFSRWILVNVDAHELHHIYPQVAGYLLPKIDYEPKNLASWWRWALAARRLPAQVFFFQNRNQSGSRA